jgi:hypothetical protein
MMSKAVAAITLLTMSGHAAAQDGTIFLECDFGVPLFDAIYKIAPEGWQRWDSQGRTFSTSLFAEPVNCGFDNGAVRIVCTITEDVLTWQLYLYERSTKYIRINRRTGGAEIEFGGRLARGECSATEDPRPPARF